MKMKKSTKVLGTFLGLAVLIGACSAGTTEQPKQEVKQEQKQEAPKPKADNKMTKAKFDQIKNGMTLEEVNAIVGSAGELNSSSGEGDYKFEMYSWKGSGDLGANANVTLQADKVSGKAQFGLK